MKKVYFETQHIVLFFFVTTQDIVYFAIKTRGNKILSTKRKKNIWEWKNCSNFYYSENYWLAVFCEKNVKKQMVKVF